MYHVPLVCFLCFYSKTSSCNDNYLFFFFFSLPLVVTVFVSSVNRVTVFVSSVSRLDIVI